MPTFQNSDVPTGKYWFNIDFVIWMWTKMIYWTNRDIYKLISRCLKTNFLFDCSYNICIFLITVSTGALFFPLGKKSEKSSPAVSGIIWPENIFHWNYYLRKKNLFSEKLVWVFSRESIYSRIRLNGHLSGPAKKWPFKKIDRLCELAYIT